VKILSERIKEQRQKIGLTQIQLAEKLDISPSMIGMVEAEHKNVSLELLIKMCNLFKCSSDYLLGLVDEPYQKIFKKENINVPYHLKNMDVEAIGNSNQDKITLDKEDWDKISTILDKVKQQNK
jgi:transcriptional regulator with XRE-family HTH domain